MPACGREGVQRRALHRRSRSCGRRWRPRLRDGPRATARPAGSACTGGIPRAPPRPAGVEPHVLGPRQARAARRPAIHAGGPDRVEEGAVGVGVAPLDGGPLRVGGIGSGRVAWRHFSNVDHGSHPGVGSSAATRKGPGRSRALRCLLLNSIRRPPIQPLRRRAAVPSCTRRESAGACARSFMP